MASLPALQLWRHGTLTCHITPTTEHAPYRVVILLGDKMVADRSFDEHPDALAHALETLGEAMQPR